MTGAKPCTDWLPAETEQNEKRLVKTGRAVADDPGRKGTQGGPSLLEISHPGVFAAGAGRSGSVKRCGAAVGEGSSQGKDPEYNKSL